MSKMEGRKAVGAAMREAYESLRSLGTFGNQNDFAEAVARKEGRGSSYSQTLVSDWFAGRREMSPSQLMAIEAVLGLPPGTLTQYLGYVPVGAVGGNGSVEDAVARDVMLTPSQRELLLDVYQAQVARTRERRGLPQR